MANSNCKYCGHEIVRRGVKIPVFCSLKCKGDWQREQKESAGITPEWLYQKYVVEQMSTYEIGELVNRDSKRVWEWLKGYGIPLREREWSIEPNPAILYQQPEWLREQYLTEKHSSAEIAAQFGVHTQNIIYFLRRFNIPTRDMTEARKAKYWGASGDKNPMYGKRGKEVPNWKGGCTPERQAFYSSLEWAAAAKSVWRRDKGTCQRCQIKANGGPQFHIHHIISFAVKTYRAEPSNLVLLCAPCHQWVHSKKNANREFIDTSILYTEER